MKDAVIYAITNRENGKQYIGSTCHRTKRWWAHKKELRSGTHHCEHLQRAWNKYGGDAFEFSVLERVENEDDLFPREQSWLDAAPPEIYNSYRTAGSARGHKASAETRAKLSAAVRGRTYAYRPRGPHSEETRARIAAALTGRKLSEAHRQKCVGRRPSDETRARQSAAAKARSASPEQRAELAARGRLGGKRLRDL